MSNKLAFDPYRTWLNVTNPRRPPNAYSLLCLNDFESNPALIREAAIRQRGAIQDCRRNAEDRRVWLRINNQLEEAINILTDPQRKSDYDAQLPTEDESQRPVPEADQKKVAANGSYVVAGLCGNCGNRNGEERKFCSKCGSPLWEPCPRCGEQNSTGEGFCGQCGVDLAIARGEAAEEFQRKLAEAEEHVQAHRYDLAIASFTELGKNPHPRLKNEAQAAARRSHLVVAIRDEALAQAEAALKKAQTLLSTNEDEAARHLLLKIPEPLRLPEHIALIDEADNRLREVDGITTQIREMVGKASPLEVVPLVEQLLHLRPHHPLGKDLAPKLYAHLHKTALKQINRFQYSEGYELLRQIPLGYRSAEVEKLLVQVEELAHLSDDLHTTPYIDPVLINVAERLVKVAPGDKSSADLLAKINQRAAQPPKDPLLAAPTWAQAPQKTFLGPPVDWIAGFRQIVGQEALNSPYFMELRGGFFVACGLALQGLGQAPLRVNLVNATRGSMVDKLSGFIRRRKTSAPAAWGVDISATGLKAIRLMRYEDADKVVVDACDFIKHDKNLNEPATHEERREIMAETVKDFVGRHELKSEMVCVGMHRSMVLGRFFKLPPVVPKKIPAIVQYEVTNQVPFPLADLGWDYQLLNEDSENPAEESLPRDVLLLAAKRQDLDDRLQLFKEVGLEANVLQCDALALHNFVTFEYFGNRPLLKQDNDMEYEPALAIIDVGSDTTNVVVSTAKNAWYRSIASGGDDMTRALVREYKLTFQQAEMLKRDPTKARRLSNLHETLRPCFQEIAREIQLSLTSYHTLYKNRRVQRVLCVGGGILQHGLARYLRIGR